MGNTKGTVTRLAVVALVALLAGGVRWEQDVEVRPRSETGP